MTTYRIARMAGRAVTATGDFKAATLGEAFEEARGWWRLSTTTTLRCLGVVLAPLPKTETVTPTGQRQDDVETRLNRKMQALAQALGALGDGLVVSHA